MDNIIEVRGVSKNYSHGGMTIEALREVTFTLPPGTFNCIVGASGSGKSTLINLLGGLEAPTGGEIYIGNTPLHQYNERQLTEYRRRKVGIVFQFFHLLVNLTAIENVEVPLEFNGISKKSRRKRALKCLELAGLDFKRINHKPNYLSGGEQQRVAIARALAINPQLILADEPIRNLDSEHSDKAISFLQRLAHKENKTVLIVSHDEELEKRADNYFKLKDGVLSLDR